MMCQRSIAHPSLVLFRTVCHPNLIGETGQALAVLLSEQIVTGAAEMEVPLAIRDQIIARAHVFTARRRQIILVAGDTTTDCYLILSGRIQVSLLTPNGRETIVREIKAHHIFGEMSALDLRPRSADVVALVDSQLAKVSSDGLHRLISEVPNVAIWLAQHLTLQIRHLTNRVYELSTMAAGSRLQCELLRLCIESGIAGDSATIEPVPTHAEFAAKIGTNRETVTREFGLLSMEGVLVQSGRQMIINSVDRLHDLIRRSSGESGT